MKAVKGWKLLTLYKVTQSCTRGLHRTLDKMLNMHMTRKRLQFESLHVYQHGKVDVTRLIYAVKFILRPLSSFIIIQSKQRTPPVEIYLTFASSWRRKTHKYLESSWSRPYPNLSTVIIPAHWALNVLQKYLVISQEKQLLCWPNWIHNTPNLGKSALHTKIGIGLLTCFSDHLVLKLLMMTEQTPSNLKLL